VRLCGEEWSDDVQVAAATAYLFSLLSLLLSSLTTDDVQVAAATALSNLTHSERNQAQVGVR
jgi:hypothetical protein